MTPDAVNEQIDTAAAALPDGGRGLLERLETDRRERDETYYKLSWGWQNKAIEAAADRVALEAGEVDA
jgi:hypothetical protein